MSSKSNIRALLFATLIFTLACGFQSVAQAGGPKDHSGGFFLRLSAGGGYADTKLEDETASIKISGGGADVNLAIGAVVANNLAIHATLFGWGVSDPDVELAAEGTTLDSFTASGDVLLSAIGGGLTYYIMPINIYLSGSVGVASIDFDGAETDSGVAMDLTIGKEWWVGNSWGLGVAGAFGYHSISDGDVDLKWEGSGVGLRFTATMN